MVKKYFITISPRMRDRDPKKLYDEDSYVVRRIINKFSRHYCLYPEFSKEGRLHYHGIVHIHDMIKFCKVRHKLANELGFVKWDFIKDWISELRSLVYSMKNWAETSSLIPTPLLYKRLKGVRRRPTPSLDKGVTMAWLEYGFTNGV